MQEPLDFYQNDLAMLQGTPDNDEAARRPSRKDGVIRPYVFTFIPNGGSAKLPSPQPILRRSQPSSSSASMTMPAQPPTLGTFPRPPPSLRVDPYELTLPRVEPEPETDEEVEDDAYGRNQ